jgi:8-oxo-dGTP pyrophosphatase MutT (NUDIX family)
MRNRAAAIIIRDGALLLIHRRKPGRDYYILPGGGVELDESFENAVVREVKEETGLDVLGIQRLYSYKYRGSEEVYFLTRVPAGEPALGGSEALRQSPTNQYSFEWITPEQLEEINLQPPPVGRICREIMRKYR